MLQLAGERAAGTTLWLADERTIASHVVPTITQAAEEAGRPAPRILAGVPVCLCRDDEIDAAIARTNRTLSEVEASPNYVRLMEHGDAKSIGDVLVCGERGGHGEAVAQLRRRRSHRLQRRASCRWARAVTSSRPRPSGRATFLAAVAPSLRRA